MTIIVAVSSRRFAYAGSPAAPRVVVDDLTIRNVRVSISASAIAIIVVTAVMVPTVVTVASLVSIAPMAAAVVDHGRRSIFAGRRVDHRRRGSPTEGIDIDADAGISVRGGGRHHQRDHAK
jgi:heme/copper-type cytochrome/quinol oxidase subunit 2